MRLSRLYEEENRYAFELSMDPAKFAVKPITPGLLEQMAHYDTEAYRWDIYKQGGQFFHIILRGPPGTTASWKGRDIVLAGIPYDAMDAYKAYKAKFDIKGYTAPTPEGESFDPADAEV